MDKKEDTHSFVTILRYGSGMPGIKINAKAACILMGGYTYAIDIHLLIPISIYQIKPNLMGSERFV